MAGALQPLGAKAQAVINTMLGLSSPQLSCSKGLEKARHSEILMKMMLSQFLTSMRKTIDLSRGQRGQKKSIPSTCHPLFHSQSHFLELAQIGFLGDKRGHLFSTLHFMLSNQKPEISHQAKIVPLTWNPTNQDFCCSCCPVVRYLLNMQKYH